MAKRGRPAIQMTVINDQLAGLDWRVAAWKGPADEWLRALIISYWVEETVSPARLLASDWTSLHKRSRSVVVKYFLPPNFEHSSSFFLLHSSAVHRYAHAA